MSDSCKCEEFEGWSVLRALKTLELWEIRYPRQIGCGIPKSKEERSKHARGPSIFPPPKQTYQLKGFEVGATISRMSKIQDYR